MFYIAILKLTLFGSEGEIPVRQMCIEFLLTSVPVSKPSGVLSDVFDSHSGDDIDCYPLSYEAVWCCKWLPTFRRKLSFPPRGLNLRRIFESLATAHKYTRHINTENHHWIGILRTGSVPNMDRGFRIVRDPVH